MSDSTRFEVRATVPALYQGDCPGRMNPGARQGHYGFGCNWSEAILNVLDRLKELHPRHVRVVQDIEIQQWKVDGMRVTNALVRVDCLITVEVETPIKDGEISGLELEAKLVKHFGVTGDKLVKSFSLGECEILNKDTRESPQ